jgi:hypothetical protein
MISMHSKIQKARTPRSINPVFPLFLAKNATTEEEKVYTFHLKSKQEWANQLELQPTENMFRSLKKEHLSSG